MTDTTALHFSEYNSTPSTLAQAEHRAKLWAVLVELFGGSQRAESCASALLGQWHDARILLGLSQAAIRRRAGCTEGQARRIKASLRLCFLCGHAPPKYLQKINGPANAAKLVRGLGLSDVERIWVVALSAQSEVLGIREVARGSIHQCTIEPRSVFEFLLDARAHRGLVAHNHPNGSLSPSTGDRLFTARIVELGAQLGLPIIDHLVITREGYSSAANEGWHDS